MHLNNGYECLYYPEHPAARRNGYVYKHRLVMEEKVGRVLKKWEIVHHIDGNKLNNCIGNLDLVSNKEHAHRHKGVKKKRLCQVCGKETKNRLVCSNDCSYVSQRKVKNRPTKQELFKLVWTKPVLDVSRELGVSDTCVKKWCRGYGISVPGRGYWQKKSVVE